MFSSSMSLLSIFLVMACLFAVTPSLAFAPPTSGGKLHRLSSISMSSDDPNLRTELENVLAESFPTFYNVLFSRSEEVVKKIRENANVGYTIFAPNEAAFEAMGEKKIRQLMDDRNFETATKMAAFHTIGDETVPLETLLSENVGGVLTMGGEVRVGPSQTGGFFGIGAKDDGGVVVGTNGRIIQSGSVGAGVIHEVDNIISPEILWRYIDQLRIPGTG